MYETQNAFQNCDTALAKWMNFEAQWPWHMKCQFNCARYCVHIVKRKSSNECLLIILSSMCFCKLVWTLMDKDLMTSVHSLSRFSAISTDTVTVKLLHDITYNNTETTMSISWGQCRNLLELLLLVKFCFSDNASEGDTSAQLNTHLVDFI